MGSVCILAKKQGKDAFDEVKALEDEGEYQMYLDNACEDRFSLDDSSVRM